MRPAPTSFFHAPYHREELLVRVRSLIKLKRTRERLEEERNRLQLLYEISRATNTQLNLQQMMVEIITHTRAAVDAAKGSIFLIDENRQVTHKILVRAGQEPQFSDRVTREVMSRGLAGWVVRHNRGDIVADVSQDPRWITLPDDDDVAGSVIGTPLSKGDRIVGVLFLIHPEPNYFQVEHLALLETVGAQVTAAIENAYLFNEISEQRRKLAAILAQSTDAIITTDESWNISLFNQAAETLFELNVTEVIGHSLRFVPELDALIPLFVHAHERPVTEEINIAGGRTLYTSVSPVQGVGYVAVMQNVTEMKRAEERRLELERREKALVKETFSRYMGTRLVEHVLSHDPDVLQRQERRQAVVMFADLRGFTRMIVTVEPNQAIQLLNRFFSQMTDIVHEFDGTIFDLAGDEVMVGFNVPFDQPDAAYRAFLTAVSMQLRFNQLRQEWYTKLGTELGLGIGIDQGFVVVGNVGAEDRRMNFAMVGEAVNTAHRLVDIALDGQIIISESIFADISAREFKFAAFESMGAVPIEGKPAPQVLYRTNLKRVNRET